MGLDLFRIGYGPRRVCRHTTAHSQESQRGTALPTHPVRCRRRRDELHRRHSPR